MPRARLLATLGVVMTLFSREAPAQTPEIGRLKSHVMTLASPEFAGRRGAGAVKAREYVLEEFRRLGLEPLFGGSYTQDVVGPGDEGVIGVNLGARIVGADPEARDRWVILGAHYDHLGSVDGVVFPGADDNASGVAMMLEVARSIAQDPRKPRRSVAFLAFDLEERGPKGEFGLRGSQYFVRHSPIALEKVALFVTADMIGRSLGGFGGSTVFVLGSEREPEVRPWIAQGTLGKPLKVALLGSDMLLIDRSDYGPFRARGVPYLFFTTGESPVYHKPWDVPETIEYPKLEAISQLIHAVVREAASGEVVPAWTDPPVFPVGEAFAVRDVLQLLLDHRDELKIAPLQQKMMAGALRTIDGIEARGVMTTAERGSLVRVAQVVLFTVL